MIDSELNPERRDKQLERRRQLEEVRNRVDEMEGRTPLHKAALRGKHNEVKRLLSAGADVNSVDSNGRTPLHTAAEFNRSRVVKILLDNGAEIDSRDLSGGTALHAAAWSGRPRTVKILLAHGANVNDRGSTFPVAPQGNTPLGLALCRRTRMDSEEMAKRYTTVVKLLQRHGGEE